LAKGQSKLVQGDFSGALKTLDAAGARTKDPATLAQIELAKGLCFGALQEFGKAEAVFLRALMDDPDVRLDPVHVDPALVSLLNGAKEKLRCQLVVTAAVGARLSWDGAELGQTPFSGAVSIGTHTLGWSRPGASPLAMTVVARAGQTLQVVLPEPLPSAPAPVAESGAPPPVAPPPAAPPASVATAAPPEVSDRPRMVGAVEGRTLVDPQAGVGAQLGVGLFSRFAFATLSGTFAAADSVDLGIGVQRRRWWGPLGVYASLDGVLFVHPEVLVGVGANLGASVGLSRWVDLLVEVQGRHLQSSPDFRSNYVLLDAGLRVYFSPP
jgi:hypothetical protein